MSKSVLLQSTADNRSVLLHLVCRGLTFYGIFLVLFLVLIKMWILPSPLASEKRCLARTLTSIVPGTLECCFGGFLWLWNHLIYHRLDESANRGRQIVTAFRHCHAFALTSSFKPVRQHKWNVETALRRTQTVATRLLHILAIRSFQRAATSHTNPIQRLKMLRSKRIFSTKLICQLQRLDIFLTMHLKDETLHWCRMPTVKQSPCQWTNDFMDTGFSARMASALQFLATGNSSEWSFVSLASLEYL